MAKLYATLENSKGKTVSISDNESITATLYDGNMKAYSVTIECTTVGDPEHIRCNNCYNTFTSEQELRLKDDTNVCPHCDTDEYLMDIVPEMGAIITTREWRNEPDNKRKAKATGQ